jgi:rare lipoprotein A
MSRAARLLPFVFFLALLSDPISANEAQSGVASVYAYRGGRTASGETVNPSSLTAAHRTLPFGTKVLVTNIRNSKTVIVRINDRGPFIKGRVIDITPVAATTLGFSGLARVTLVVVN